MGDQRTLSRRGFLARIGVLGVAVGSGGLAAPALAGASPQAGGVIDAAALRPLLADLARDTLSGLAVFVVPGPDPFSRAQGTPRREPGAIEAGTPDSLVDLLDRVVPFPDAMARPVAAAFRAALSSGDPQLPRHLVGLPASTIEQVDAALGELLTTPGEGVPLSLATAMLLNLLATHVDERSIEGRFLSPFARLTFDHKAQVFALLEGTEPDLIAALGTEVPQDLLGSLIGVLRTFGAPLLELPALCTYSESHVFDPATRTLTGTPVGWTLTGYRGGRDGWDDFRGYYQGRTEVRD
jgi:hypothetical protein